MTSAECLLIIFIDNIFVMFGTCVSKISFPMGTNCSPFSPIYYKYDADFIQSFSREKSRVDLILIWFHIPLLRRRCFTEQFSYVGLIYPRWLWCSHCVFLCVSIFLPHLHTVCTLFSWYVNPRLELHIRILLIECCY